MTASVSATLLVITVVLWAISYWVKDPRRQHITLGPNFHVTVNDGVGGEAVGRLVLFNDSSYGPYRGSMMWVDKPPQNAIEHHFGDTAGIYFRYFKTNQGVLWTLMVSFWYPLILFAIAPAIWLIMHRLDVKHPGYCPKCRYDIRASTGHCPECGTVLPPDSDK